ncbi:hypothetical protein GTY87_14175 [Streptomyces sp. SID7813]|uniref:Uncharacterized protein n=1 Tax=Streptomyces coelicolor (strain ATCC BAA-471 / A3(2) / M145) TaxID=100226 RepID=Q9L063_STRCO|nr:hypothetical protein [Streptomyces sp. SID7813]QFI42894.1 hypothetical protein FQ762_14290 [Streptomyces coelicolor A3(2)]CAB87228.1 hypothetical protein SCC105.22c [Streptomyces coelicolor A3(2)]
MRGNRSVDRCFFPSVPPAPACLPPTSARPLPGRDPLGTPQQQTARGGDGGQAEGRAGGAREGGAVPEERHRDEEAAERRPADEIGDAVPVGCAGRRVGGTVRS